MNGGGGVGGFIATRDEERYAREYPTLQVSLTDTIVEGERAFGLTLFQQSSYGSREEGKDWTGNSVYLWAIANAAYMSVLGPTGFEELGRAVLRRSHYAARRIAEIPLVSVEWPTGFFKEFVVRYDETGLSAAQVGARLRAKGIFGGKDLSGDFPGLGQSALYCVTEVHTRGRHRSSGRGAGGGGVRMNNGLRKYHAAVWDEPLVMEMGAPGRRGCCSRTPSRSSSPWRGMLGAWCPRGCDVRRPPTCRSCPSRKCSATTCTCRRRRWG